MQIPKTVTPTYSFKKDDLGPCPVCGAEFQWVVGWLSFYEPGWTIMVQCVSCKATLDFGIPTDKETA